MPRGGRSSSPRSSGPARSTATRQAPAPAPQAQAPAPARTGGMFSGLGGTLMQGMAFGAGSEVAHQAIRGVMGSNSNQSAPPAEQAQQQQVQQQQQTCSFEGDQFSNCLKNYNDIAQCQSYMDIFKECQKKYKV